VIEEETAMNSVHVGAVPMLSSRSKYWRRAGRFHTARRYVLALVAIAMALGVPCSSRAAGPEGQLTWAVHVTLAPTWFDPAETSGIITPYMVLYAIHDAMVKPMPGNSLTPSLADRSPSATTSSLTT
jgi:peptide/nickel transport system substrate-binding protein